ncbi:MAG: DUF1697 domain-containing protein [Planctomycetota bacterium]
MATWIGLLRGINVGGHRKIKMAELRNALQEAGLSNVETYIQSGNLVFDSKLTSTKLENLVHQTIEKQWGFDVPTMVFRGSDLEKWKSASPFQEHDISLLHLTIFSKKPTAAAIQKLGKVDLKDDEFKIQGRCFYGYMPRGYSKTKLTNGLLESKLGVRATTRNWKTVGRLLEMVEKRR